MVNETSVFRSTTLAVIRTIKACGMVVLKITGESIADQSLLFLQHNQQNLRIDTIILSRLPDNMRSRLTAKHLIRHADEVTVPYIVVISLDRLSQVTIITWVLTMEKVPDVPLTHGGSITHDEVSHDITIVVAG